MIDLSKFYINHFDTDRISDDKLRKYCEIHIQRLAGANETGNYTKMITDTTIAYNEYFGAITDEDTNSAIKQSLTKTKDNVFEIFKKTASQKEGIVRGTWGIDSPKYKEFFPQGLTEYTKSTLANVETLMTRIVNAANNHQDELGEAFVKTFKDIKENFTAARTSQLHKLGEVSDNKVKTSTIRDVLEIQLMNNVLTLAKEFIGKPDEGMKFFDQTVL